MRVKVKLKDLKLRWYQFLFYYGGKVPDFNSDEYIEMEAEPIEEVKGGAPPEKVPISEREPMRLHQTAAAHFVDKENVVECDCGKFSLVKCKRLHDFNCTSGYLSNRLNEEFDNIYAILEGMRK